MGRRSTAIAMMGTNEQTSPTLCTPRPSTTSGRSRSGRQNKVGSESLDRYVTFLRGNEELLAKYWIDFTFVYVVLSLVLETVYRNGRK